MYTSFMQKSLEWEEIISKGFKMGDFGPFFFLETELEIPSIGRSVLNQKKKITNNSATIFFSFINLFNQDLSLSSS